MKKAPHRLAVLSVLTLMLARWSRAFSDPTSLQLQSFADLRRRFPRSVAARVRCGF